MIEKLGKVPGVVDSSKPVSINMYNAFDESCRSIVMYPCRNFELLNCVCICRDDAIAGETTESWSAAGDLQELLSIFSDFPAHVLDILG